MLDKKVNAIPKELTSDSFNRKMYTSYLRTLEFSGFGEEVISGNYFDVNARQRVKKLFKTINKKNIQNMTKEQIILEKVAEKSEKERFERSKKKELRRNTNILLKYAIKNILGLYPEEVKDVLTIDILKKLNLFTYVNEAYFQDSILEFQNAENYKIEYLLSELYPHLYKFNYKKFVWLLCDYKFNRLDEVNNNERKIINRCFNRLFDDSNNGRENFNLVMSYLAGTTKIRDMSIEELYQMFADLKKGINFFKQKNMTNAINVLFAGNTLNAFHEWALGLGLADEVLYEMNRINSICYGKQKYFITYCNTDGTILGKEILYQGEKPNYTDLEVKYWVNKEGEKVNFEEIKEDIEVYAKY